MASFWSSLIKRRYDIPYEQQQDPKLAEGLHALEANLEVFPKDTAQVLEYWLDVSRFSRWKRPGVKLPWNREIATASSVSSKNMAKGC